MSSDKSAGGDGAGAAADGIALSLKTAAAQFDRGCAGGAIPVARGAWFMVSNLTQLIMISNQAYWLSMCASHQAGFSLT